MKIVIFTLFAVIIFPNYVQSSSRPSRPDEQRNPAGNQNNNQLYGIPNPNLNQYVFSSGVRIPVRQHTADLGSHQPLLYGRPYLSGITPAYHAYPPSIMVPVYQHVADLYVPHFLATSSPPSRPYENQYVSTPHTRIHILQRIPGSSPRPLCASTPHSRTPEHQPTAVPNSRPSRRGCRPSLARNGNNNEPVVVKRKDGTGSVDGIQGRFLDKWFLPYNLQRLGCLQPCDAARMHIRILTPASYQAGPIQILSGDLVYRAAKRVARARGQKIYSDLITSTEGRRVEFTSLGFDILVRNEIPYGQFDRDAFYPYIEEARALPRPAE